MRPGGYVGPGLRGLLPRHATAHGFQFEAGVLSGFHGAAHGLADEGWNFDSALLNIEHYGSGGWQL